MDGAQDAPAQQPPRPRVAQLRDALYPASMKYLGGLVLDKKKDIRFHRNASHIEGAQRYAKSRGWTAQHDDINGDDEPDIVLFDKKGRPVMINGYTLAPSEHKIREKYFENPVNQRIQVGGYKKFKKAMRGNADLELEMQGWKDGYAKIRKPPRPNPNAHPDGSLYQRFCAKVKPLLERWIASTFADAGANHPARVQVLNRVIPFTSVYAALYLDFVISNLWAEAGLNHWVQEICAKTTVINPDGSYTYNPLRRFELFKKRMSKHSDIVNSIITDEVLDRLPEHYTDETLTTILNSFHIDHDDIYQEGILPVDTDDLSTAESRGAIAYEKELIMNEIHDFKDGFVRNVFNNVWDGRSYVKPADDDD